MALTPCPHCQRHVDTSAERCPFCEGALPPPPQLATPASGMAATAPPAPLYGMPAPPQPLPAPLYGMPAPQPAPRPPPAPAYGMPPPQPIGMVATMYGMPAIERPSPARDRTAVIGGIAVFLAVVGALALLWSRS